MRTWVTATMTRACGGHSAHVIHQGEIYVRVDIGQARLLRCGLCAEFYFGQPAPSEAPPDVVIPELTVRPQPEPFDARMAAAGKDSD